MKIEPSLDRAALLTRVRQEYGLDITRLTFLPKGEGSHNYIAERADGCRYVLKLLDTSRLACRNARRLDFTLELIWHLHSSGLFTQLPCPLRTRRGGLLAGLSDMRLVITPFVEGSTLEGRRPYPEGLRHKIAVTVAALHRSTSCIRPAVPAIEKHIEHFDVPFEAELRAGLDAMETITSADRPGQQGLKALLLPHKRMILGLLDRLHALQQLARVKAAPMVLCHTDLTEANLLLTPRGELFVLDWDGAMLAPAEHDLFLFTGKDFPAFLQAYQQVYGAAHLDSDRFGFYFYRRNLEDLADWVVRILHENAGSEQDQSDLEGIRADCIDWWSHIEADVDLVKSQLAAGETPSPASS